jgi:16S rRNA (guanine966-N2)-methyltransferase
VSSSGAGPRSAGRVIAGTARGIRLAAPGSMTRPLADRVKEALFAILEPDLRDAAILDLFAGSGAAGIEALSRGAASATFIDRDRSAEATIRENLVRTHLAGPRARVVRRDALAWLAADEEDRPRFRVVVVDPPYDAPDGLTAALEALGSSRGLLDPGAVVVAKHFWRDQPPARIGLLASVRARRFGDTALTFYRLLATAEGEA